MRFSAIGCARTPRSENWKSSDRQPRIFPNSLEDRTRASPRRGRGSYATGHLAHSLRLRIGPPAVGFSARSITRTPTGPLVESSLSPSYSCSAERIDGPSLAGLSETTPGGGCGRFAREAVRGGCLEPEARVVLSVSDYDNERTATDPKGVQTSPHELRADALPLAIREHRHRSQSHPAGISPHALDHHRRKEDVTHNGVVLRVVSARNRVRAAGSLRLEQVC
jgi:hypothetical protein